MKNSTPKLNHADVAVGVLTGMPVAGFASLLFGAFGVILGAFVGFLAAGGSKRQRDALQQRIDAPAPMHWDVVINKVRVGSISDSDYAGLERAVHSDWRVFYAQGRNLFKVGVRAAEMLIFAVPVALFWVVLAIIFVDPESAAAMAESLRSLPGGEIVAAVERYTAGVLLFFVIIMFLFAMVASPRLGYENIFRSTLGEAVRRRVQAPSMGRLVLVPCPAPVRVATN